MSDEEPGTEDGRARRSSGDAADATGSTGSSAAGASDGPAESASEGELTDEQIDAETPGVDDAAELEAAEDAVATEAAEDEDKVVATAKNGTKIAPTLKARGAREAGPLTVAPSPVQDRRTLIASERHQHTPL